MLQVPYLPLAPSLWLTVPSLALLGSGSAAVVVASYTSCLQAALATPGHAEAAATYSLGQLQHAPHPVLVMSFLGSVRPPRGGLLPGQLHRTRPGRAHVSEGELWSV